MTDIDTAYKGKYKEKSTKGFVKEKIRMLEEDFLLSLTDEQKSHMYALTTEVQVDNYVHKIIMN